MALVWGDEELGEKFQELKPPRNFRFYMCTRTGTDSRTNVHKVWLYSPNFLKKKISDYTLPLGIVWMNYYSPFPYFVAKTAMGY